MYIGNGKLVFYENIQSYKVPEYFCNIVSSKNTLIENIRDNDCKQQWLYERAFCLLKMSHVDEINFKIREILISFNLFINYST